ncbi:Regulator of nonsense transcripts 1 [Fusarium oxysporum f. sp. cubense race 1]|uniref:Regulator of nonsense transcripts 1 n=1 Tax=Fusarium oxysporum f. sp. cubense (strain race 1) TaxID=1229664 RepID=N4UAQ3_FUSC1|nr:Regulator of nonsense transcripts 1 [Fusarium oxysporum f. sp. cubense race 1]
MRRYIQRLQKQPFARKTQPDLVRSANYLEVHKVVDDLRKYTCDAMAGQEIHSDYKAMKKATEMAKRSDTIFTTCIGAGIGLNCSEFFDIVTVDEASQQTEPSSLVPLVKGCSQATLVGDHVQLRPTVNQTALALDFDISLFERLYTKVKYSKGNVGLRALMLDTQYPRVTKQRRDPGTVDYERAIFINCDAKEMPGQKSKENRGKLKRMLSSISYRIEVSSIDRFQGREADVIVFVTVRCKEHREIGFLKDMRRMNVALTRARSALIVVGSRVTLTEGMAEEESESMWRRLLGSLTEVKLEVPVKGSVKKG